MYSGARKDVPIRPLLRGSPQCSFGGEDFSSYMKILNPRHSITSKAGSQIMEQRGFGAHPPYALHNLMRIRVGRLERN